MASLRFDMTAAPTVGRFMQSDAFVRGILGPFRSGKTSGCVMEILHRAGLQKPQADGVRRTRFIVARNTYRELKDTTRRTFESWIPARFGSWVESDFKFVIHTQDVHSEILFRALDKPGDISRLLSLEVTGAYINEAREVPKVIFDGLQGRVGQYPAKKDGGCSWRGVWFDTNPWPIGHWGHELFQKHPPPEGFELYEQPSGLADDAENLPHLDGGRGYYERLAAGKDADFVDCYIHGKCPRSDVGSFFGAQLAALEERGGLEPFEHETDGVLTFWDLGLTDATAIWFVRFNKWRAFDYVDHYEGAGMPMSHYFAVVEKFHKEKGYSYTKHCLPHDARAKTLQTGRSILDMCIDEWGTSLIEIVPRLSIEDRIQAGRNQLERPIRIHPRVRARYDDADKDAIECLRAFHKEWDEEKKVYKNKPVHDWTSHSADAFTYSAVYADIAEEMTRPKKKPEPPKVKSMHDFTLDELWAIDALDRAGSRSRIP